MSLDCDVAVPSPVNVQGLGYVAVDHLNLSPDLQADVMAWLRWWDVNIDAHSTPAPTDEQLANRRQRGADLRDRLRHELPADRYRVLEPPGRP